MPGNLKRRVRHLLNPMRYRNNSFTLVGISLRAPKELKVFIIQVQNQRFFINKTARKKRRVTRKRINLGRKEEAHSCPSQSNCAVRLSALWMSVHQRIADGNRMSWTLLLRSLNVLPLPWKMPAC